MPVKNKCENSKHREWIEERAKAGASSRDISDGLLVKFGEQISHVTISAYLNTLNSGKKGPSVSDVEDTISRLEERLDALEVILSEEANTAGYASFKSYTLAGKTSHTISYKDIILVLHPDKKDVHGQYKTLVARIKSDMVKEGNLILSDESFIKPRAELNKKNRAKAAAGLAAAEEELVKREAERVKFMNAMEELVREEKANAQ